MSDDTTPTGTPDEPVGVDPAAASAAADPLPGTKRRGRPPGSKNRSPLSPAQLAQRRAASAKGGAASKTASTRTGPTDAQLRDAIANFYAMTGMGLAWIDQEVGQTVAECAATAAEAWVRLGQQNPAVRRVLVQMTTASGAGELLMAHAPLMALAIARLTARNMPPGGPGEATWTAPVDYATATTNGAADFPAGAQPAPGYVG